MQLLFRQAKTQGSQYRLVSDDLLRDLVQCVQATRDGLPDGTLFTVQCDLVLAKAKKEANDLLLPRACTRRTRTRKTFH